MRAKRERLSIKDYEMRVETPLYRNGGDGLYFIVGAPCLINIIHKEVNGRKYESISSIMALPKGMQKPQMIGEPTIFDLDESPLTDIENLPKWIGDIIRKSETYTARLASEPPKLEEMDDDGEPLPF